jgi:putative SOS response-associated peptidase YedK
MCNLYSMRKSRDELVKLFGTIRIGNDVELDFSSIYPDAMAPVIRQEEGGARTLTMMRWLPTTPSP